MRRLVLVGVVAWAAPAAAVRSKLPTPAETVKKSLQLHTFEQLLAPIVEVHGLHFEVASCKPFETARLVRDHDRDALASCLSTQMGVSYEPHHGNVTASLPFTTDQGRRRAVIELRFSGSEIVEVGPFGLGGSIPTVPVIDEPQLVQGFTPSAAMLSNATRIHARAAKIDVCAGPTGTITSTAEVWSTEPELAKELAAFFTQRGTYPVTTVHGTPIAACHVLEAVAPDNTQAAMPVFGRNPENIPATELLSHLTAPTTQPVPDAAALQQIRDEGLSHVTATMRLCVDEKGAVVETMLLHDNLATFYASAVAIVAGWSFSPFTVNGVARPVCAYVTWTWAPS